MILDGKTIKEYEKQRIKKEIIEFGDKIQLAVILVGNDSASQSYVSLVGDFDFTRVSKKTSVITPVPGGIGLMTMVMLLNNTVKLACLQKSLSLKKGLS